MIVKIIFPSLIHQHRHLSGTAASVFLDVSVQLQNLLQVRSPLLNQSLSKAYSRHLFRAVPARNTHLEFHLSF